jgi:hypothetical protein
MALISAPDADSTEPVRRAQPFDMDSNLDVNNNRVNVEGNPVKQEFGYCAANNAQGKAASEIGGRIQRCTTPAWFGKHFQKAKSWDQALHCSGRFVVTQTSGHVERVFRLVQHADNGHAAVERHRDDDQRRREGQFGIFAHEGGGRASRVYWDELEYTASSE